MTVRKKASATNQVTHSKLFAYAVLTNDEKQKSVSYGLWFIDSPSLIVTSPPTRVVMPLFLSHHDHILH